MFLARHLESDGVSAVLVVTCDMAALVVAGVGCTTRVWGTRWGGLGGVEDFLDLRLGWWNEQGCSVKLAINKCVCSLPQWFATVGSGAG